MKKNQGVLNIPNLAEKDKDILIKEIFEQNYRLILILYQIKAKTGIPKEIKFSLEKEISLHSDFSDIIFKGAEIMEEKIVKLENTKKIENNGKIENIENNKKIGGIEKVEDLGSNCKFLNIEGVESIKTEIIENNENIKFEIVDGKSFCVSGQKKEDNQIRDANNEKKEEFIGQAKKNDKIEITNFQVNDKIYIGEFEEGSTNPKGFFIEYNTKRNKGRFGKNGVGSDERFTVYFQGTNILEIELYEKEEKQYIFTKLLKLLPKDSKMNTKGNNVDNNKKTYMGISYFQMNDDKSVSGGSNVDNNSIINMEINQHEKNQMGNNINTTNQMNYKPSNQPTMNHNYVNVRDQSVTNNKNIIKNNHPMINTQMPGYFNEDQKSSNINKGK